MQKRIVIVILILVLIMMIANKQSWDPFKADDNAQTNQTALAANEEMQKAFDAGQAVWLVFSSDT